MKCFICGKESGGLGFDGITEDGKKERILYCWECLAGIAEQGKEERRKKEKNHE